MPLPFYGTIRKGDEKWIVARGDTTIFRSCQAAHGSFTARHIPRCTHSTGACPRAEAAQPSAGPSSPASQWVKSGCRTPLACPEEHRELLAVFKHSSVNPMQYSYPSRHSLVWGSAGAWDVGRDAHLVAWAKLGCRGASTAFGAGLGLWDEFTQEFHSSPLDIPPLLPGHSMGLWLTSAISTEPHRCRNEHKAAKIHPTRNRRVPTVSEKCCWCYPDLNVRYL